MTEKDFINKIGQLKEIRPSKNWVVLTKEKIFEKEPIPVTGINLNGLRNFFVSSIKGIRFSFGGRLAFASTLSVAILFGLFVSAQGSLPGSTLFPLKRITEKTQAMFISQKEQPNYNLEIAQKRLKELIEVTKKNSAKNLAPAINEYQASVSKVAENLSKTKNKKETKDILAKVQDLKSKESKIKSSAALIGPNKKMEAAYEEKTIETLEPYINDLKNRSLTDEQIEALKGVEKDLENKDYDDALMKLLLPPLNVSK